MFMKRWVIALAALVLIVVGGFAVFALRQEKIVLNQRDLERIQQESYESIFVSMYSTEEYSEEDFSLFRGLDIVILAEPAANLWAISEYLDKALATENGITNIYLGIDPAKLWEACRHKTKKWNKELENELLPYLSENSHITFEIMLPYPKLDYWVNMTAKEREEAIGAYYNFINCMEPYSNVTLYYMGAEQWLISNPANYTGEAILDSLIAQKLMLYTFCDHEYQIRSGNADFFFDKLKALVAEESESPFLYPEFSEWKVIFWGDSVIGNYVGSFSVPGVVSGLTEADTYNYAIGGTQATDWEGYNMSFPDMVEQLKNQSLGTTRDDSAFPYEVLSDEDLKLCFVVHYGLNDYFNGVRIENAENPYDAETFSGALRVSVRSLKEAYPDAVIILMTPPYCSAFSSGTEVNSQVGGALTDYVAAVEEVAKEQDVVCMNNYVGLGITEDNATTYLLDGVHLSEQGRFVLGQHMIATLEHEISKK